MKTARDNGQVLGAQDAYDAYDALDTKDFKPLTAEEVQKLRDAEYKNIDLSHMYVDNAAMQLVRAPKQFDVIVTGNLFGDILSDLTAELSGSLGLGGSLNAGRNHAMGQAAHGSAPDIAGQDIANPFSLILSAAQLLAWHGHRKGLKAFEEAAKAIEVACLEAVKAGEATRDVGGRLGTAATGEAIVNRVLR